MVRITLSFAPNKILKSSQDNEWEVQKVYRVKYQINSNYNSYMNSITIPMTKVFVGTNNATANKFYTDPFIRFRVMGTNMVECSFTAKVKTNQTKKMLP